MERSASLKPFGSLADAPSGSLAATPHAPRTFVAPPPAAPLPAERRQRVRVGVEWELQFCLGPETLLVTYTENLSSAGFYCVAQQALATGAYECLLRIPAHAPQDRRQVLYLRCQVQVLRVEPLGQGRFGVAARIQSYHAFTGSSLRG